MTDNTTTSSPEVGSLAQALGFEPGDYVSVATDKVQRARTISADELDFEYSAGLLSQEDTWIGAQPVRPTLGDKRAKHADVACVRVLYADFDRKDSTDFAQIDRAISQLSLILGTGPLSVVDSGGGLHPRWKLEKPVSPEDAKGVLNRWKLTVLRVARENGFKADSVFDLPRVLRLPGTVNEKYDPPMPTSITLRDDRDRVSTSTIWSKLDHANAKPSPLAAKPDVDDEELRAAVEGVKPIERPQSSDSLSERAVNSEVRRDLERLEGLSKAGWDGEPWHNTTRDVAYRLAKIATSPGTSLQEEDLREMFLEAAPRDDEGFDEELLYSYWNSGMERADEDFASGNTYELAGSGDDLFGEDMDEMLEGIRSATEAKLGSDVSFDDFESSTGGESAEPRQTLEEFYSGLALPLIPGFGGKDALRGFDMPASTDPSRNDMRVQGLGDRIADLHPIEHDEYMHPHCRECFPDRWRSQLYRWIILSPSKDPSTIRPPLGRMGPTEGYLSLLESMEIGEAEQLIDGYLPAGSVGILRGRGTAGKTFLALDMALAIADPRRVDWRVPLTTDMNSGLGTVSEHGEVLFLASESAAGVRDRMMAAVSHTGADLATVSSNFTLRPKVPNFFTGGAEYDALLRWTVEHKPRLIVVDTMQKATIGAEQNSASDMSIVYGRFAELKEASDGGTVMVIAHTGHDDSHSRGSSSIEDDADFVIHVEGKGTDPRKVSMEKLRDGAPGPEYVFSIMEHGGSAVAVPLEEGVRDDKQERGNMILVAQAIEDIHSATSQADEVTRTEILGQIDGALSRATVNRSLKPLLDEQYVSYTGSGRSRAYRLTPQGRAWLDGQGLQALLQKGRKS